MHETDPITGKERPVTWEAGHDTWMPTVYLRFFKVPGREGKDAWMLHQLWMTPLGVIEWRKIPTGNMKEEARLYAECQAFNESPDDSDLPF